MNSKTWDAIKREVRRSKEPDPHVLARKLYKKLSPAVVEDLALVGLEYAIRMIFQSSRQDTGVASRRANAQRENLVQPGPSKWAIQARLCVNGVWKLEDECSPEDFFQLAEERQALADAILAVRNEYLARAEAMLDAGCATWGEYRKRQKEAA